MNRMPGFGEWTTELLRVFDEDASHVKKLTLVFETGGIAIATIEKFIDRNKSDELITILKKAVWIDETNE